MLGRWPTGFQARWIVATAVSITIVSYALPLGRYVVYPMMLLSTYAHEMGHGIAALLVGGQFLSLGVAADGSGVALTVTRGPLARAVVAAGGLLGPAILGAVLFVAAAKPHVSRIVLGLFACALLLSAVLVVRSLFGWGFLLLTAGACAAVALRLGTTAAAGVLAFLAAQLAASVFSRADYLFTPVAHTAQGVMASDVAVIAQALWLPYWVWGLICGLFSLLVLLGGLLLFWRRSEGD